MSKKATEAYMTTRREDQRDAWYAGADAVLEASMKEFQRVINQQDNDADKQAVHALALRLYAVCEAAFTRCPFQPGTNTKPPVLPVPNAIERPTV